MFTNIFAVAVACCVVVGVNAQFEDSAVKCANSTIDTICAPEANDASYPYGAGPYNFLLVSGLPHSKAVSVKVRRQNTSAVTELSFYQYNVGITDPIPILSARSILIIGDHFDNAFTGTFQYPCSLFPEGGNTTATFDYLLTHYYGEGCAANATNHCIPLVKDVPPLHEPRHVVLKNIPSVCEE